MKVQVIMPTAGSGTRMLSATPKPFLEINGKPLFVYSLEIFESSLMVESVILVVSEENIIKFQEIVNQYKLTKVIKILPGGQTRCESVSRGLKQLDEDTDIVVIHDGARPLVTKEILENTVCACEKNDAVITAVKVKPTIKEVDPDSLCVKHTLDRENLWEIQTPQAFRKNILLRAHAHKKHNGATDDAMLIEQAGGKVKIVEGSYQNIKVTTSEDLVIAEIFLNQNKG